MLRATFRNLAARKLRLALSAFAIVLGVAFVVGSFVFTDTLDETFERLFSDANSDVIVRPVLGEGDQFQFTGGDARTLPAAMVDDLAGVDGVDRADGVVSNQSVFVIGSEGRLVGGTGAPGIATNWTDAPAEDGSNPLQVVDGREPRTAGEVVLETKTADRAEYEVGDRVTLVMPSDPPQIGATLVGITDFGNGNSLLGATLTLFDTQTGQDLLLDGEDVFNSIAVTADDGADVAEVRDRIAQTLPEGVEARTGAEVAAESEARSSRRSASSTPFCWSSRPSHCSSASSSSSTRSRSWWRSGLRRWPCSEPSAPAAGRSRGPCSSRQWRSAWWGRRSACCSVWASPSCSSWRSRCSVSTSAAPASSCGRARCSSPTRSASS